MGNVTLKDNELLNIDVFIHAEKHFFPQKVNVLRMINMILLRIFLGIFVGSIYRMCVTQGKS